MDISEITEIEIRFNIHYAPNKEELNDQDLEDIRENIQSIAEDEYRLCNMIDFDFEGTDYEEKRHDFRAVFSDN